MNTTDTPDTPSRILAAATPLFAQQGFDAVGVRMIASAAKVNIAAVNYHFGSKDGLIAAVCERHLRRVSELRIAELDRLESAGAPPTLEQVIEAYIRPSIRLVTRGSRDDMLQARLVVGYAAKARDSLGPVLCAALAPSSRRFGAALARALPGCDPAGIPHAMHMVVGLLVHAVTCGDKLAEIFPGVEPDSDPEQVVRRLVVFGAAGIRALAVPPGA